MGIKKNYYLSKIDREFIVQIYPPLSTLNPNKNVLHRTLELDLISGQGDTYYFTPSSRGMYKIAVTGEFDSLILVFDPNGNKLAADDDTDYTEDYYHQANVFVPLEENTTYSLFVRLYGSDAKDPSAILIAKKVGEIKS